MGVNRRNFLSGGIASVLGAATTARAAQAPVAQAAHRGDVLRHLVLATRDLKKVSFELQEFLGLKPRAPDMWTAENRGFYNEMHLIGTFMLEIVSPVAAGHHMDKWLIEHGGDAGRMLVLQTFDMEALRQRARAQSLVLTKDGDYAGIPQIQFDNKKFGTFFEYYQYTPPENWFGLPPRGAPYEPSEIAEDVVGADVAVEDPAEVAALSPKVFSADAIPGENSIRFGHRVVRFVPIRKRRGLVAFDVKARDRGLAGRSREICGTEVRLV
jgi:hypothetical protein